VSIDFSWQPRIHVRKSNQADVASLQDAMAWKIVILAGTGQEAI